ncbi:polysaccharide deacetylase family protein [Geodermatophilus sabuli]|uniref:Polysaccharide deacetylase n=1 Tax=Geodermatophilus sabuli TaxID=1564158 RepID=A0A285EC13_9ACTN|nr:polysaccharide deacetylase family protein [Geodermatophilus sabuli]MBB3083607.1 peptidoglycan/xylan/chitin deacetylase (PgdA/CDA1 family) [Geodermatophilus sabuli]SNX96672.1 Polysaccharide deacetylase [Geodermatophilus sabuli]
MSRRLLVLGYHNIEPTYAFHGTTPEAGRRGFERQVRFLRRWTNVVPLRSALADLRAGRPLPPRAVALTFDDGYLDNVTVAAPVLHAAGLPASFFLVPGFLSDTAPVWWEQLGWAFAHATVPEVRWDGIRHDTSTPVARRVAADAVADALKLLDSQDRIAAVAELRGRLAPDGPELGRQFMDWDEAGELLRLGHEIESHTCAHPILSRETPTAQSHELTNSRRELADHFQRPVDVLAYPNGRAQDYSAETVELAGEAGYAFAVTTRTALAGARSAPLEVPRVLVDAETDLREVLRGAARVAKRVVAGRFRG